MEKTLFFTGENTGKVIIDYLPMVNYAMVLNNYKVFNSFVVINIASAPIENINIRLSGDMFESCSFDIEELQCGNSASIVQANLIPSLQKLMALTEAIQTSFNITIKCKDKILLNESLPLMLLPFNQWHGENTMPELLASFVTPNHPCLVPIIKRASDILKYISGDKSLDDYQSNNYLRILQQVKSMYESLLEENILYATMPASFENRGQRIRLVDDVLQNKMGNCIELSLLLCSCLENIGLRTIVVLFQNHVIMGVWLDPTISTPMVGYDISKLEQMLECEVSPLLLIESVGIAKECSFEEAVEYGRNALFENGDFFNCFIDVRTARMNQVRPLPQSVLLNSGWHITNMPDYDNLLSSLVGQNPYEIKSSLANDRLKNKQQLWECKLLDLSLRNSLINMRSGKNIVPIKVSDIGSVLSLLKQEKLLDVVEEQNNFSTVKDLYRAARNSIEENGANTLFLSIGTLRWYEEDSCKPYFAPIIFVPIEIVRSGARKYLIRGRDEECLVNITLIEMMKQIFDLEMPLLMPIPFTENDQVNYQYVFETLQSVIDEVNETKQIDSKWEIIEECMIGIFSFSKFVMWNDIHANADKLASQPVLKSLIEGHLQDGLAENAISVEDIRLVDSNSMPADYAIPLDADSSQLSAIVDSGKNKSFIIYGPPGTGKSQTITNMIANALYQNKRVLFVSEKKAALDVVHDRLKRIGLEPFCLELHSNKANKKSFLAQMEMSLNVSESAVSDEFLLKSKELYDLRLEINGYVEALHQKTNTGLSLFEYINRYLEIKSDTLILSFDDIKHLSFSEVNDICDKLRSLDIVSSIIGKHPKDHSLRGLYPRENTIENQKEVSELVAILPDVIAQSKKKHQHWINRYLFKRTLVEILQKSSEWGRFFQVADVDNTLKFDIEAFDSCLEYWKPNLSLLRQWYHFSLSMLELKDKDIDVVIDFFMSGKSGEETASAFLKAYYQCVIIDVIENNPHLRCFSGLLFEKVIEKYRSVTRQFQQLTEKELVYRLSQRVPKVDDSDKKVVDELTLLRKRIANNGRATSVRRILDQVSHILPKLSPCMLMSPLSVAQYLKMENDMFDLVIFDEASQMPTSEAVGAIARAKNVIVVGDPKQMPPTCFFMTKNSTDEDIDYDDLDSILDDCISLGMSSHHLNWHYRSKHESLIAFSNTNFYDGRLITFPSVDNQDKKVILRSIDGYYDFGKTRSNKAEAKAIVDEIINRLTAYVEQGVSVEDMYSIGVVAFSKVQSMLIEDMLMDALSKKPQLEKLALHNDEPIFVKNLENVQGDERDIILFSVGYGPDKNGKVSMNFGPLNQVGGERRLNVAVSRARYEMVVFSTLKSYQIDLQRSNATGVMALKRFLEYVEVNSLPQPISQLQKIDVSPIARQIADIFMNQGYEVHFNVGCSNFKIDLAVVDKENPLAYTKAIILDGLQYYQTPTVRDREIIQPNVLSSLGWNVQHVWTADWLESNVELTDVN